jgi:hypothetical protein
VANLYELGLLNWGFTKCARLLNIPGPFTYYLTNFVSPGFRLPQAVSVVGNLWGTVVWSANPVVGGFPYGYNVEPDR